MVWIGCGIRGRSGDHSSCQSITQSPLTNQFVRIFLNTGLQQEQGLLLLIILVLVLFDGVFVVALWNGWTGRSCQSHGCRVVGLDSGSRRVIVNVIGGCGWQSFDGIVPMGRGCRSRTAMSWRSSRRRGTGRGWHHGSTPRTTSVVWTIDTVGPRSKTTRRRTRTTNRTGTSTTRKRRM